MMHACFDWGFRVYDYEECLILSGIWHDWICHFLQNSPDSRAQHSYQFHCHLSTQLPINIFLTLLRCFRNDFQPLRLHDSFRFRLGLERHRRGSSHSFFFFLQRTLGEKISPRLSVKEGEGF